MRTSFDGLCTIYGHSLLPVTIARDTSQRRHHRELDGEIAMIIILQKDVEMRMAQDTTGMRFTFPTMMAGGHSCRAGPSHATHIIH
jgi:hypothetical protein